MLGQFLVPVQQKITREAELLRACIIAEGGNGHIADGTDQSLRSQMICSIGKIGLSVGDIAPERGSLQNGKDGIDLGRVYVQ